MSLKKYIKMNTIHNLKFRPFDSAEKFLAGGIYRMFNSSGEVIYVGKSGNLNTRLNKHLAEQAHTAYFMPEVSRIDYLQEVDPVYETLLEAIFIAYHKPCYNDEVKTAKEKFGESYGK
jgi:excinuclease UvrABC nuclease subunit